MLAKTVQYILCLALNLGIVAVARADTAYTFTHSTTVQKRITASGSITSTQAGTNLPVSDISDWNISFSGGGLDNLNLTPANSTFTFQSGSVIDAALQLSITAPAANSGFELLGNAKSGTDTFIVDWVSGSGPAELMTISVPEGNTIATGANFLSFPASFTTDTVGATSPVPEPSSLVLLGTGCLSIAAAGLRRIRGRSNV